MKLKSAFSLVLLGLLSYFGTAQQKYALRDALRVAQQNNPSLLAERLKILRCGS